MRQPPETITVETNRPHCDGGANATTSALGHPRVFLTMDATGKIDCPYCGRRFVRTGETKAAGH